MKTVTYPVSQPIGVEYYQCPEGSGSVCRVERQAGTKRYKMTYYVIGPQVQVYQSETFPYGWKWIGFDEFQNVKTSVLSALGLICQEAEHLNMMAEYEALTSFSLSDRNTPGFGQGPIKLCFLFVNKLNYMVS
ncbi:hypothetical protein [Arsenicibacter rosenii]|uniref:Uncharacterized protein n=1 Tax=Arsenicibacter rosenii TaxID=1750698 RepID=A0A1S2VR26_9BACT|nr:hypothetical protein [Arsenicibacter rosenii]OIN61222.1 hypothetical protein BLX24_03940 [Arsenicibacter rosenii]